MGSSLSGRATPPPEATPAGPRCRIACGGCSKITTVQASSDHDLFRFRCPHCKALNEFNTGLTGPQNPRLQVPSWWQTTPHMESSALLPVSRKVEKVIQKLLDDSWRDAISPDRRDFQGTKAPKLQVVQVQQNHNPRIWLNYTRAKEMLRSSMRPSSKVDILTNTLLDQEECRGVLGDNEVEMNEALLFHGTKPSACESICQQEYNLMHAGSHGSSYGSGVYFAENCTKSDEYATDDTDGIWAGLYAMLLCKVTLGRLNYTDAQAPDTDALKAECVGPQAQFDSILGDGEKASGTFKEYVVYNVDLAYPEYVIIYRRLDEDEEDEESSAPAPAAVESDAVVASPVPVADAESGEPVIEVVVEAAPVG